MIEAKTTSEQMEKGQLLNFERNMIIECDSPFWGVLYSVVIE